MNGFGAANFEPPTFQRHLATHPQTGVLFHYTDQNGLLGIVACSEDFMRPKSNT